MNTSAFERLLRRPHFLLLTLVVVLAGAPAARAAGAKVTGLLGLAHYAKAGGAYQPLVIGTVLQQGDVIQTATGSALDLELGTDGTVRLLQSTTLALTRLAPGEVLLELKGGELLGKQDAMPGGSKFRIEVPSGIAGIVDGTYRLNSRGYIVLLEGTAVFVESAAADTGSPAVHTLNGSVYFSPVEHTVRPAPKALQREVRSQLKARVPKK